MALSLYKKEEVMDLLYPGAHLFEVKAAYGLSLEAVIDKVFELGIQIDWCSFIDCARSNGWYDFQTIKLIEPSIDGCMIDKNTRSEIITRAKLL